MAEYKQPTDDQLHEMMRRFIKTLPPTVCEVKRQEKKDEEKINVSHEAHDVFHGEVEHTILHDQVEALHLDAVLPEHNCSTDLSLNTVEMPRRHDVLPREPFDQQGKALGVSAYLPSCDVA